MDKTSFVKTIVNKAYQNFSQNPGSFLLWAGIIGWIASCVSQTVAIVSNDKISDKQKKFLIPQEITDGIVNTLLFAFFTRSLTKFGEKLVHNGKIATKTLAELYQTTKVEQFGNKTIKELIGTEVEILKNGKKIKQVFHIGETVNMIDPTEAKGGISKIYWPFATGVIFAFSTLGSIISCDAVTPLVRNKFASYRQKQALEKDKLQKEPVMLPDPPALPAQNKPAQDSHRPKLTSITSSSGSMRI